MCIRDSIDAARSEDPEDFKHHEATLRSERPKQGDVKMKDAPLVKKSATPSKKRKAPERDDDDDEEEEEEDKPSSSESSDAKKSEKQQRAKRTRRRESTRSRENNTLFQSFRCDSSACNLYVLFEFFSLQRSPFR